ncbi:ImuA family protein [Phreatobacter oligotrophus]|uniref:Protein ImuA n=1 Tax=Phreatobacter oligotrophus TaxID=1122261 RepID=A0A2T4Z2X9_9HYPH|nr:hypothetical protein [Phreatobacter oligotrophus]PTM55134.1 protein ImuA [Phreatobacter oligotrophus]
MTARRDTLAALKGTLARLERGGMPPASPHADLGPGLVPLGAASLDAAIGGGIARAALHEVHAEAPIHVPAATGFTLGLARRTAPSGPLVWVRQRFIDQEFGRPYGRGLAALGLDPSCVVLVRVKDAEEALKATLDAARCGAVGAIVAEIWGAPKILDLTASRRLSLAAAESGVTVLMTRAGAEPEPSAALSRWRVRGLASEAAEGGLPGRPAFSVTLLRHRAGIPPRDWSMEWDREHGRFRERTALPGRLAPLPAERTAAPAVEAQPVPFRRAG